MSSWVTSRQSLGPISLPISSVAPSTPCISMTAIARGSLPAHRPSSLAFLAKPLEHLARALVAEDAGSRGRNARRRGRRRYEIGDAGHGRLVAGRQALIADAQGLDPEAGQRALPAPLP